MENPRIEMTVGYGTTPVATRLSFEFDGSPESFQQAFLKRFGNIRGTNKAEKHRKRVKELTYQIKDMAFVRDWAFLIGTETTWRITILRCG